MVSYLHIPHFLQWYGFLSTLVKCLQMEQKYADIWAPQLRHFPLSSPIYNSEDTQNVLMFRNNLCTGGREGEGSGGEGRRGGEQTFLMPVCGFRQKSVNEI